MQHHAIKTNHYLEVQEIEDLLEGVEYIIMATPAPEHFSKTPIHVTIFLNTQEYFSQDIKELIFDKFCQDYKISASAEVMSQIMPVGFANTTHDTPMPMLLVKPADQNSIPYLPLHVIDFLAASDGFEEVTKESLTGWSYVRE
jgi:hypothetical protein